jgi:site-specific recombinase
MMGSGMIKVVATVGKGLTIIAKGHTARIVAMAAAVGIVTISVAMALGMYLTIRSLGTTTRNKEIPIPHNDPLLLE